MTAEMYKVEVVSTNGKTYVLGRKKVGPLGEQIYYLRNDGTWTMCFDDYATALTCSKDMDVIFRDLEERQFKQQFIVSYLASKSAVVPNWSDDYPTMDAVLEEADDAWKLLQSSMEAKKYTGR
jgi:hypothetical protein